MRNYIMNVRSFNECIYQALLCSRLCELTRLMIEHFSSVEQKSTEDFSVQKLYNLTATLAHTYSELQKSLAYFKEPAPKLFKSQNSVITQIFFSYYSSLQRAFTLGIPIEEHRIGDKKVISVVQCFEKGYL